MAKSLLGYRSSLSEKRTNVKQYSMHLRDNLGSILYKIGEVHGNFKCKKMSLVFIIQMTYFRKHP